MLWRNTKATDKENQDKCVLLNMRIDIKMKVECRWRKSWICGEHCSIKNGCQTNLLHTQTHTLLWVRKRQLHLVTRQRALTLNKLCPHYTLPRSITYCFMKSACSCTCTVPEHLLLNIKIFKSVECVIGAAMRFSWYFNFLKFILVS